MRINTPVQQLQLRGRGVVPEIPDPYTLMPGDTGYDVNKHIMVGQFAINLDDNYWYYRGKGKIYRFKMEVDDVTAGENSGIEVFKYTKTYLAGNVYVSFSSVDPAFVDEAIYRCIIDTNIGESPETHPAKWDKQSSDFTIKPIKIEDIEGLGDMLSYLYKKSLTSITTIITIPDQKTIDYYVEILSYSVGSYSAINQIEVINQTSTTFTVESETDYEAGELIYRIQKFN